MTELGDDYRAWTKSKQDKRWQNLQWSTQYLLDEDICFSSHNNGVHLIVSYDDGLIDFWPSTGKWIFRSGKKGRGVKQLVAEIRRLNAEIS